MAPSIRALAAMAASMTVLPGTSFIGPRYGGIERKPRKCSNPGCNAENTSNAPYCSGACCRAARAARALSPLVLLLLLAFPLAASAEVLIVSTASDKPGILPTTPELRAALDRWRENFEARPSCAKCGLVCDCGDCRCEAAKAVPVAAPVQYRTVRVCNGNSCRVVRVPVQSAAPSKPVYVPQRSRGGFLPWRR